MPGKEDVRDHHGKEVWNLGWRTVPVSRRVLDHKAKECMPCIMQAFVKAGGCGKGLAFDRMLYIARREFEQSNDNKVVSMNSRTIVYKVCSW